MSPNDAIYAGPSSAGTSEFVPSESSHRAVMDTYAVSMTRNPGDVLVSARSLLWNNDTHSGAFEIIYTEPAEESGASPNKFVMRVVRIATKKGSRAIALRKSGGISESYNAAWEQIVSRISIGKTVRLGTN